MVFPGFSYRELLNLDPRDREIWHEEAIKHEASCQIDRIHAACAPWMEDEARNNMIESLQKRAEKISDQDHERTWARGRADLAAQIPRRRIKPVV